MKKEDLFRKIGFIEEDLIQEASSLSTPHKKIPRRLSFAVFAAACMLVCTMVTAFAVSYVKDQSDEWYLRYLSPFQANLEVEDYQANKFFHALDSKNTQTQYIAIHQLIRCYNDEDERKKAIEAIKPFQKSKDEKVAEGADFALDILTQRFESKSLCRLADGGIYFSLFPDYSDYGSDPTIWRILNGKLEEYITVDKPTLYLREMIPSPDGKSLALVTCSNKSTYLMLLNPLEDTVSPELMDSARGQYGEQLGEPIRVRVDHENYSDLSGLTWLTPKILSFKASFAYDNEETVVNVAVQYDKEKDSFSFTADAD